MLDYKALSSVLLLGFVAACAPRTLTLVDFPADAGLAPDATDAGILPDLADAGVAPDSADGNPGDAFDTGAPANLRLGLVGLWHLDDGVGSAVAVDSSGNGNDGTLVGLDKALAWTAGRQGGALALNGAGYVLVPSSASINGITTQVTVSAWVFLDGAISATDLYGTAISRETGNTDLQFYHLSLYQDGAPTLFIGMSPTIVGVRVAASQNVAHRQWTHLAGTYDGARAVLYVNGVEVASRPISGTLPADTTPVILGGNGNKVGITEWFPGSLDEIALFDRALSPEEIHQLSTAVSF